MRYEFMVHLEKDGWYVVTDTKWMFTCEFQAHRFNETQTFLDYGALDRRNAQEIATAMRELGDWLFLHHYSEVFAIPDYEVRLSDDDSELHIIRHISPEMDAVFKPGDLNDIADILSDAAQFVRKMRNRQ